MTGKHKRTIFIVDDDASVRKALSRLLRSAGFHVETFLSGEQFLARSPSDEFGCVLLDIQMSGMSGMALQQELMRARHRLPIIFVTGYGDISTRLQAMQRGAVEFLTKPIDDNELLRAVETAFKQEDESSHQI